MGYITGRKKSCLVSSFMLILLLIIAKTALVI